MKEFVCVVSGMQVQSKQPVKTVVGVIKVISDGDLLIFCKCQRFEVELSSEMDGVILKVILILVN